MSQRKSVVSVRGSSAWPRPRIALITRKGGPGAPPFQSVHHTSLPPTATKSSAAAASAMMKNFFIGRSTHPGRVFAPPGSHQALFEAGAGGTGRTRFRS